MPRRHARALAVALCAAPLFNAQTLAQTPAASPAPAPAPTQQNPARASTQRAPRTRAEADPEAAGRRLAAVSLLTSLAEEARGYRDGKLRARVLAQTADALWESEPERARALFQRAWEAADTADRESARQADEVRRQRMNERRGAFMLPRTSNLRGEVLRLAARRDRALGEEFLAQLSNARAEEANAATPVSSPASDNGAQPNNAPAPFNPTDPPVAYKQRIQLARRLLEDGDTERAMQIVEPALDRVSTRAMSFLSSLRERNASMADQRFAALLARAGADPSSDAVTVSILSSYIFTPYLYSTVSREGGSMTMQETDQTAPPADMPAALRLSFLRAGARILLRPLPPPDQDTTFAGRSGTYFTIARLLPLYEQYLPEQAAQLRGQIAALTPDAPERLRNGQDRMLTQGLVPVDSSRDEVQDALDRAERAATPAERDRAFVAAALAASHKGEARAADIANRIEDTDLRARVRAFVDFGVLQQAIRNRETDAALRLARRGEITRPQRVWAFTQIAKWLLDADRARAIETLEEAATEARRIVGAPPDLARALVGVASLMVKADLGRTWELMSEIVRVANGASEFAGTDAQIGARIETQGMSSATNFDATDFDLTGLFVALARQDMSRATELARMFTNDSPRATATLAIARSALETRNANQRETREVSGTAIVQ